MPYAPHPKVKEIDHAQALRHLKRRDPVMRRLVAAGGACTLARRRDYFPALCEAIVCQQLSVKAGATIYRRFCTLFPRRKPMAKLLAVLDDEALRGVGLSRQKANYLRDLAAHFADGRISSRQLARLDETAVIESLTRVKGVGVWTVQMFLIFVLCRPDVLPVDDLGIRRAAMLAYGLKAMPSRTALEELAEPWRPYRTYASWYLWRSLDNAPMV